MNTTEGVSLWQKQYLEKKDPKIPLSLLPHITHEYDWFPTLLQPVAVAESKNATENCF